MMFQRALPDVAGLGVITSTPGLTRSSQPVMCFGLPLRTTNTTTESATFPLYGLASQPDETMPSLTRRSMSGSVEKLTTSAGWPESTARLWDPDDAKDDVNDTPLPCDVCSKAAV